MKNNDYEYDVIYDKKMDMFKLSVKYKDFPPVNIPLLDIALRVDVCGKGLNESK